MCIITLEDSSSDIGISKTKIFARHTEFDFQLIVYSMSIKTTTKSAMILPIPVKPNSGEDAIKFIDMTVLGVSFELSLKIPEGVDLTISSEDSINEDIDHKAYLSELPSIDSIKESTDFFGELSKGCYPEYTNSMDDPFFSGGEVSSLLKVHEVGDYLASYIPSKNDFNRLDPCFRLKDEVWDKLPNYDNYGFVVFQLKTSLLQDNESVIPPMAFEFPTAYTEKLFFPTIHVHGDSCNQIANYDHVLYCQRKDARSEFKYQRDLLKQRKPTLAEEMTKPSNASESKQFKGYTWYYSSADRASNIIHPDIHKGVIDPEEKIYAMILEGEYLNMDIFVGDKI